MLFRRVSTRSRRYWRAVIGVHAKGNVEFFEISSRGYPCLVCPRRVDGRARPHKDATISDRPARSARQRKCTPGREFCRSVSALLGLPSSSRRRVWPESFRPSPTAQPVLGVCKMNTLQHALPASRSSEVARLSRRRAWQGSFPRLSDCPARAHVNQSARPARRGPALCFSEVARSSRHRAWL